MEKRVKIKIGVITFVIIFSLILIFQTKTILSSNVGIVSNQDIIASKPTFMGGGGASKTSLIQGVDKINIKKNRYASSNNKAPIVTLIEPNDKSIDNDGEIDFIFTVQDDGLLRDCTLYHDINGRWLPDEKNKNSFAQPNYSLHFTIKNVPNGDYIWNIVCQDAAFNTNSNNNFSFSVKKILPEASSIPDLSVKEDGIFILNLSEYFFDVKGDTLDYEVEKNNNVKVKIDKKSGIATIEPKKNWFGQTSIKITAFDEHGSKVESNPIKITVSEEGDTPPSFISLSPENNFVDDDGYLFLDCNVTDDNGLKEVSLYSDTSGEWKLEETQELSGLEDSTIFLIKDLPEGNYEWACLAKDNIGQEAWSERQKIEVDIDVEIVHDIPFFIVNNVDASRYVVVSFSSYLKDYLTLGYLTVRNSNGEIYYKKDMSEVSYFEVNSTNPPKLIYPHKIRIIPNKIFDNDFKVGNKADLIFTISYSYKGSTYIKEIEQEIKIVKSI